MSTDLPAPWGTTAAGTLRLVGDGPAHVDFTEQGILGRSAGDTSETFVAWEDMWQQTFGMGVPAVGLAGTRLANLFGPSEITGALWVGVQSGPFEHTGWDLGRPLDSPYAVSVRNATEEMAMLLDLSESLQHRRWGPSILGDREAGPALLRQCLDASSWSRIATRYSLRGVVRQYLDAYRESR